MKVATLTVELKALAPARLPYYKGAVIRGGFGLAFRRVCCPFPKRECTECLLRKTCAWFCVFVTPRPDSSRVMPKSQNIPHPFVIEPPLDDRTQLEPGETLTFGLTLVGKGMDYVPYFIYTFELMAEQGLGPGRAQFAVMEVRQADAPFYDAKTKSIKTPLATHRLTLDANGRAAFATLRFLTPTHIIHEGRMARRPAFQVLLRSLVDRICMLAHFHDESIERESALIEQAEAVSTVAISMHESDWRHHSSRQNRNVDRRGMLGSVTYEGDLGPFLPYLRAGEVLHVGSGTSFGMGKYQLEVR